MALVDCHPFVWNAGFVLPRVNSLASANSTQLNTDTEYLFFHFTAPATETIDKVEFRVGTVTTSGNVEVSICTVAADGSPDTLQGSEISVNVTSATNFEVTGLGASLTAGTLYGVRFMVAAGVDVSVQSHWGGSEGSSYGTNVVTSNVTGSVARLYISGRGAPLNIGTSSGYRWVTGLWSGACGSIATTTLNSTGTDFAGNKIVIPFKCRISGLHLVATGTTSADLSALITNSSGTILASRDLSSAQSNISSANNNWSNVMFDADVAQNLEVAAGTTIYALAQAQTAANYNLAYLNYRANASLGAFWGTSSYGVSGTVLGTFTDHNTRIYGVFPIITALDDGAGGSSTSVFTSRPSTLLRR